MTLDRIDASPNRNEGEDWHCPDCQSWGPFTVDVTTRVILSEEGTPFLEDEGGGEYDDMVFSQRTSGDEGSSRTRSCTRDARGC